MEFNLLRKNKKGVIHADWAISMGIFIIYVSFLIIFIIPSLLKTQFDPSTLLNSFEENFLKPIEWTVVKVPLTIEKFMDKPAGAGGASLATRVILTLELKDQGEDYRFTEVNPDTDTHLQTLDETDQPIGLGTPNQLLFLTNDKKEKMKLGCGAIDCNNRLVKYTIAPLKTKDMPEFSLTCNLDDTYCKFALGIEEKIEGIKEKPFIFLNELNKESPSFQRFKTGQFSGYSVTKTDLKFPDNKDFDIRYQEDFNKDGIVDGNKRSIFEQADFHNTDQKPPQVPENVNVFIKEFKKFYVDEKGEVKPVIFYFEVW